MSLLRSARRVAVASAVHGSVQRRQRDRWAAATPAADSVPASSATGGATDVIVALERLGALRDSGVLTEAEFAAQKARILG